MVTDQSKLQEPTLNGLSHIVREAASELARSGKFPFIVYTDGPMYGGVYTDLWKIIEAAGFPVTYETTPVK